MPSFPSAEHVARAAVTAARLCGEDPIAMVATSAPSRARYYATIALIRTFPGAPQWKMALFLGAKDEKNARTRMHNALTAERTAKSWSKNNLEVVMEAVRGVGAPEPPKQTETALAASPLPASRRLFAPVQPKDDGRVVIKRHGPMPRVPYVPRTRLEPGATVADARRVVIGDLAGMLLGDPPPGRSALDRRKPPAGDDV